MEILANKIRPTKLDDIIGQQHLVGKNKVLRNLVDNKNELNKFRGSKYVQSTIGSCYSDVKKFLNQGKYVLFTG